MKEIITCLSRKSFVKKDGRKQLIILLKIGIRNKTFTETKRFEIPIILNSKKFCVNEEEYTSLVTNKVTDTRLMIYEMEKHLKSIVQNLTTTKTHITPKLLIQQLYNQIELSQKEKNFISTNTFLYEKYQKTLSRKEYNEFDNVLKEISNSKGFVDVEDIEVALIEAHAKDYMSKERNKINKMTVDQRYKTNNFDKNNIIHLLGFCWSINPNTNCSFISDSYKTIVFHITDFIYNSEKHPTGTTQNVDYKWINEFLIFKKNFGSPKIKLIHYTPFNIHEYYENFKKAEREQLSIATFQKIVKQIKLYIKILQSENYLKNIDYNLINSNKFISRNVPKVSYTRTDHSLWPDELIDLKNKDFNSDELNLARDMYLIQVFAGGLRIEELYSKDFKIVDNSFHIVRYKTNQISKNPLFDEIQDVILRHNGIPKLLKKETYRNALTEIANKMNWTREISSFDTKIDGSNEIIYTSIKEIFKPYTARKTFVLYLFTTGYTKEEIIEYTEHKNVKTLLSYIDRLPVEYKQKLMKSKKINENIKNDILNSL